MRNDYGGLNKDFMTLGLFQLRMEKQPAREVRIVGFNTWQIVAG